MLLIASSNGAIGMDAAWHILQQGGSALDAVEAGTRLVEANPDDHTVGYSGYPNLLGEVELDASLMDGRTLRAGAVGALRGYRHAVSVARQVMEHLPHVLLAGEGAAQFAAARGFPQEDLLTEEAAQAWRKGIEKRYPGVLQQPPEQRRAALLRQAAGLATDPEQVAGTVNFIAQDQARHIASAVSTSGWAWKYPGRMGDSPVIGAGNFADNRAGAATCTGWGELALRASSARSIVLALQMGQPLDAACRAAFSDLLALDVPPASIIMSLIAIDRHGNHWAGSTAAGRSYVYRTAGMPAYAEAPRTHIALTQASKT